MKVEITVKIPNPEDKTNIDLLKNPLNSTVTIQGDKLSVALILNALSEKFETI